MLCNSPYFFKENGIDPWRVNEAFLRQQLEEGSKRVDFAGENVVKIIETFEDVPIDNIPTYRYKEVIWLYTQMGKYKYKQNDNTWLPQK